MVKTLLIAVSFISFTLPAMACNIQAEQKDPDFPASVAAVSATYTERIFTERDSSGLETTNLLLDPNQTHLKMADMYSDSGSCSYYAASRLLIDLMETTLKRHKANKVNGITFFKESGKKPLLMVSVFKEWEENPFILDHYQWDGKRFKFIKTEKFNS